MEAIEIDSEESDISSIPIQNLFHSNGDTKEVESPINNHDKESKEVNKGPKVKKKPKTDVPILKKSISIDEDYDSTSSAMDQSSSSDRYIELNESINKKNKYIEELLNDLKVVEDENKMLRNEMIQLKNKLSEATVHLQDQIIIIQNHKSENSQLLDQIQYSKKTEAVLQSQLDHMTDSNKNFETRMDDFIFQMNSRIKEWEKVLNNKEDEINDLKTQLLKSQHAVLLNDQKDPEYFNELIRERDLQIHELQDKLKEATNNLLISSQTIEHLKREDASLKRGLSCESIGDANEIEKLTVELKKWKSQNEDAENCLKLKEMELAEILKESYTFENNEIGSKKIIQISKKHKQQIKIRDDQIKNLVYENNKFNSLIDQLQTENIILRKRLNLPADQPISTDNILAKYGKLKKNMMSVVKKQSAVDEQNISLKIRLRQKEKSIKKLYEYVKNQGIKVPEHFLTVILGEETATQAFEPDNFNVQNIHEIDDSDNESIKEDTPDQLPTNQKDLKTFEIGSQPNIKMMVELEANKENQRTLQIMLKESRMETLNTLEQLAKESQKNIALEQKFVELQNEIENKIQHKSSSNGFAPILYEADPENKSSSAYSYLQLSNKSYATLMDRNLKHFHDQFESLYNNLMDIYNQNTTEKEIWNTLEEKYIKENQELNLQLISIKSLFEEFKSTKDVNTLFGPIQDKEQDFNNINTKDKIESITNNNYEYSHEILMHKIYLERKCSYLEEVLKFSKNTCKNVKAELHEHKMEMLEKLKDYEIELQKSMLQAGELRNSLSKSIPLDIYFKQNILLNDYKMKYRNLLNQLQTKNELNIIDEKLDESDINPDELKIDNEVINNEVVKKLISRIKFLEEKNFCLQDNQNEFINKIHNFWAENENDDSNQTMQELKSISDQLKLDNSLLSSKLESLEEQVNYFEQKKLTDDLEINLLSHQILDLQSTNDNKAAIARLSGEILVSHMHITDMHNKQEKNMQTLQKEKEKNRKLNNIINDKDVQFNNYILKTNLKISFLSGILQIMRDQYQGAIPLEILDNINNLQMETKRKFNELQNTCDEVNQLKEGLLEKVYDEIFQKITGKSICADQDESKCFHFIELEIKGSKWEREKSILISKCNGLKKVNGKMEKKIESLEEILVLLTFSFEKNTTTSNELLNHKRATSVVELTDVNEDEYKDYETEKSDKPIPKPRTIIKTSPVHKSQDDGSKQLEIIENLPGSPIKSEKKQNSNLKKVTVNIQTDQLTYQTVECQANLLSEELLNANTAKKQDSIEIFNDRERLEKELTMSSSLVSEKSKMILNLQSQIVVLTSKLNNLEVAIKNKEKLVEDLQGNILRKPESENSRDDNTEINKLKKILNDFKALEYEKNATIEELSELLKIEKNEHNQTSALAQKQIVDMKLKIQSLEKEHNSLKDLITQPSHVEAYNVSMEKYRAQVLDLENRCFQLQRDYDQEHAALISSRSECERWKNLAAERFSNLEKLNKHLEETHKDEVVSYKTETSHWLTELTNTKEELSQTKIRFNEFRNDISKQFAERNMIIEGLHSVNCNLKQKLLNLQSVVSASDPSFDLGAIIEVDESNCDTDNNLSDKTDSNTENGVQIESLTKLKTSFSANWSETLLERLRKEKQMLGRQNTILRKQVKILTSRERRVKLELQNIKAQMSKGSKYNQISKPISNNSEEVEMLHKKVEMLEAQLFVRNSMENKNESSKVVQIALWDKQKRWQESADKWKQKYLEKCSEYDKIQRNNDALRSVVQRIEKEKRSLNSRLSKSSREGPTPSTIESESEGHLEMLLQDKERLECEVNSLKNKLEGNIRQSSLLEKIEAQQRRITAFELAERGKDVLINEYERLLAQNTLLAKQNIKLESEVLEYQLHNAGRRYEPDGSDGESNCCRRLKQQNQHFESYIKLLREENNQLISKNIEINSATPLAANTPTSTQAKRIASLEKTVLTLRGLVSKLQAENKRLMRKNEKLKENIQNDDVVNNLQMENEQMRETIRDKDELLKNAKELLKRAAEREKLANGEKNRE